MAPKQTEIQVVPVGATWQIERDGEVVLTVQTKQVAVDEAINQANRNRPSHIVVKQLDGSVEDEAEFGGETAASTANDQGAQSAPVPAQQRTAEQAAV